MKKIGFLISAMIFSQVVFGQFKVIQNGNVGIGTNNPQQKLQVEGNSYLNGNVGIGTNNPQQKLHVDGVLYLTYGNYSGKLKMAAGNQGPIIGSNSDKVNFWYSTNNFNKVYAQSYSKISDSIVKEQISFFDNGLNIITQLNTYSYYFKDDSTPNRKLEFGLLAQEVESILPELVDTSMGYKLLDYDQFIPFLINAIKEQQVQIDMLQQLVTLQEMDLIQLRDEVLVLRNELEICCDGKGELLEKDTIIYQNDTSTNNLNNLYEAVLYQNTPNPFNTNTQISFYIPTTAQTAYLYIYNLNGIQLKSYTLTQRGLNYITLYASELPAGMYLYTLVVDNVIIDSKRMILTK